MKKIKWLLILFIFLFVPLVNYGCNSTQPPQNPELVKQINELLDKIDSNPAEAVWPRRSVGESPWDFVEAIAENCHLLTENSEVALPIMFKRLDNKKGVITESALQIYFVVFGKTKSAESIPYIADYIDNLESQWEMFPGAGQWAISQITSMPIDYIGSLFDQRKKELSDKLRQWYEEYKKAKK